jgi:hypothetical protein
MGSVRSPRIRLASFFSSGFATNLFVWSDYGLWRTGDLLLCIIPVQEHMFGGADVTAEMINEAEIVANAVVSLCSLQSLTISDEGDQCFTVPLLLTRLTNLRNLRSLTLHLYADWIGTDKANAIRSLMRSACPIEKLALKHDDHWDIFEDEWLTWDADLNIILASLHGHTTLRNLVIEMNPVGTVGAMAFAEMLRHNESIGEVGIICSMVGLATIVESLGANSTVRSLEARVSVDVDDAVASKEGIRRLAALLPEIHQVGSLVVLEHYGDDMFELEGTLVDELLQGYKLNTSLTTATVSWINDDAKATIEYCTTRNRYKPALDAALTEAMLTIFEDALNHDQGMSVVYDTLRVRDDWYESLE